MSPFIGTLFVVKIKVVYFETLRGDQPVRDYIESLPEKEKAKAKALIDHLSEKVVLNEPHAKRISGCPGLYELRPGSHRIFAAAVGRKVEINLR